MKLSHAAFNAIRTVVHDLCGIVIAEDKQYLVKSRLEPILHGNGLVSYESLVERLKQPNSLLLQEQIIEAITTKETSFNRDGHPFEELRSSILSELARRWIERKSKGRLSQPRVRIWCAAVATGQEAYSVAMAVADFLAVRSVPGLIVDDFSILASDISASALATAREGRYTSAQLARGLTIKQRDQFFRQEDGAWIVDASLRRMMEFRRLNLVLPLPDLGSFDLILCRNILIYLDESTRRRLCKSLHSALNPHGILMIGAAESLYGVTDGFSTERLGNTIVHRKQKA
jgi:chemotaxis protein methyltransferase CheR